MKVQVLIISVLVSLLAWGGSYHFAQQSYRAGQSVGVVPNLQIKHRVRKVANIAWDAITP